MPSTQTSTPNPLGLFSLEGKTAVVTGASGGLASAVCLHLLRAGCPAIALLDMNMPALELTVASLQLEHPKARLLPYICDISNQQAVQEVMTAVRADFGQQLNILVNTAGYCENISALDYPADRISRLINVNLTGSMIVATEFARTVMADLGIDHQTQQPTPDFIKSQNRSLDSNASIILIASMSGHIINHPQPQTPYNISKAGVIHLAKSLASEWAPFGIRVNSLSPGYILTPLTRAILERDPELKAKWENGVPVNRMAEPEEFAGPIIYMASNASSYMTGADMVVDGGYTVR